METRIAVHNLGIRYSAVKTNFIDEMQEIRSQQAFQYVKLLQEYDPGPFYR